MKKGISIRLRLTIMVTILLTICCVGLTVVLNISANKMVDKIEPMMTLLPATESNKSSDVQEEEPFDNVSATVISSSAKSSYHKESFFYMLIIVLVGVGATYYISGKVLKPLAHLNDKIKHKNVNNLNEVLELPNTDDEISQLTESFNKMSNKLNEVFLMQNLFSSNVAHELRTPLTILQTKIDVFKKKENHSKEEYDTLISTIAKNTERLSDIVINLLDLTNDKPIIYNDQVELKKMIESTMEELEPLASSKHIRFEIHGTPVKIKGNTELLHRVFYNIIENSIKYNEDSGQIKIDLHHTKEQAIIKIRDTGIGIADKLKDAVFEPFYRVDQSRSRQVGGAGLGLAIARKINQ